MTRPTLRALMGAASISAVLMLAGAAKAQVVPTDPSGGCPIPPATVAGMFDTGHVTLNGAVKAADSTVVLQPNCGFFQWSEQMFLWMTSPAPAIYGGGSRIMFSPSFYTVTPMGSDNRRTFIPNNDLRAPLNMLLRTTELGPHGLPVLLARTGQIVEVQKAAKPVAPIVRLPTGRTVTLSSAQRAPDGTLRLLDAKGAEVKAAQLKLPMMVRPRVELAPGKLTSVVPVAAFNSAIQARKIILNRIPIFIDPQGNVIDVEAGQADGGVLLSQNNSLIYYITVANDVFAYDRTMHGAAPIVSPTTIKFPMTMAQANAIKTFAATKGHTIVDPQALAVESKSSWIDAAAVPDPQDYVQATAVVPTYNTSNPNVWTPIPNGHRTIKVVMVGMHVVGSTNGHGEMVWATFEHQNNTPNATFSYASTSGVKTVNQNTHGAWLFTPNGSNGPFNAMGASWDDSTGNIIGQPSPGPVVNSVVLRTKPWGTDGSNTALNTQVISANASIISQLLNGDVRKNYFQVGSTWTIGGAAPNGGNEVGTNQLANTTMETFVQATTPSATGNNCFMCHRSNTVTVSHVYGPLKPLP